MNHYFVGREHKRLADLVAQDSKDIVEFAYFVDEKIDDQPGLGHLIINNSTFSITPLGCSRQTLRVHQLSGFRQIIH